MSDESHATPAPRAPGVSMRESAAPAAPPDAPAPGAADTTDDYRYIQIRRTIIYIEESIKQALDPFVFEHNTPATWSSAVSQVSGVLRQLWGEGKLAGATPQQAFSVQCGLGSTMSARDVRDGNMVVQVTLQGLQATPTVLTVRVDLQGGA